MGDDNVVKAWNELLQYMYKNPESSETKSLLRLMGRVLLEIRRSLGNKNTQLDEMDMFRWYIKDLEENQ